MKLSNRTDYALRALIQISISYEEKKLISAKEISEREGIPIKYLEQILLSLRMAGVIVSYQGFNGGYSLARPPEEITFGEVIRIIEGTLTTLDLVAEKPGKSLSDTWHFRFNSVMVRLKSAITDILDNTTLADIHKT